MASSPSAKGCNLVLIGMPGVGKSTIGVLLAKAANRNFLDTDVHIQSCEGRSLQEIIDADGPDAFCRLEERHVLEINVCGHVIATGGSVVYSDRAMGHLKTSGPAIHLYLPPDLLRRRLEDLNTRGVVIRPGEALEQLYEERLPLYRRYADVTVDCTGKTHEQVVAEVLRYILPGPAMR